MVIQVLIGLDNWVRTWEGQYLEVKLFRKKIRKINNLWIIRPRRENKTIAWKRKCKVDNKVVVSACLRAVGQKISSNSSISFSMEKNISVSYLNNNNYNNNNNNYNNSNYNNYNNNNSNSNSIPPINKANLFLYLLAVT